MSIKYLETSVIPMRKSKDMQHDSVKCENMKEAKKLYVLLNDVVNWDYVEGISMNGRKVTVDFFLNDKKQRQPPNKRKKKMS